MTIAPGLLALLAGVTGLPAWGGLWVPGTVTALDLQVGAQTGGRIEIVIRDGYQEIELRLDLRAGETRAVWLPVRPAPDGTVDIVTRPGRSVSVARFFAASDPLTVVVGEASAADSGRSGVVRISPAGLPGAAQAWASVGRVELADGVEGALDWAQRRALDRFAADCGVIVLRGWSAAAVDGLRAAAGCGGSGIVVAGDHRPRVDAPPRRNPIDTRDLAGLLSAEPERRVLERAGMYLLAYCILLLGGLLLVEGRPWLALLIPGLAAAPILLLFPSASALRTAASWAETAGGAAEARHASMLQLVGLSRGWGELPVPVAFGFPMAIAPKSGLTVGIDDAMPGVRTVRYPTSLLSRTRVRLSGSFPVRVPLEIREDGSLVNVSEQETGAGFGIFRGAVLDVPALPPGASWRASPDAVPAVTEAVTRLLADRWGPGPAAALPLRSVGLQGGAQGWLVVLPSAAGRRP